MNTSLSRNALAALTVLGALSGSLPVLAQVAGETTTVGVTVVESTRLAMGWSVKKTLLGKTLYNEAGDEVGTVEDLIISPGRDVSYIIVGTGGFVGIGRHDVAIPVNQVLDKAGRLVMPGATREMIRGMPEFAYAAETDRRDAFIASAETDIAKGKVAMAGLEKRAASRAADAGSAIAQDVTTLRTDVRSAESKLSEMKRASSARWQEFESDVNAATARLRKSTGKATG